MKTTILVASFAIVLTAGCSGGGDDPSADSTDTSGASVEATGAPSGDDPGDAETSTDTATAATAADVATTVADTAAVPTTAVDAVIDIEDQPGEGTFAGALDDADFECERTATGWSAAGTVTNSSDGPAAYRIFISFVDGAGETIALLQAEDDLADVEPGDARDWSVGFDSDVDGLTCVARVERRAA